MQPRAARDAVGRRVSLGHDLATIQRHDGAQIVALKVACYELLESLHALDAPQCRVGKGAIDRIAGRPFGDAAAAAATAAESVVGVKHGVVELGASVERIELVAMLCLLLLLLLLLSMPLLLVELFVGIVVAAAAAVVVEGRQLMPQHAPVRELLLDDGRVCVIDVRMQVRATNTDAPQPRHDKVREPLGAVLGDGRRRQQHAAEVRAEVHGAPLDDADRRVGVRRRHSVLLIHLRRNK